MKLRRLVKMALAELLLRLGILDVLVRRRFAGRGLVLMYHRVLPRRLMAQTYSSPSIVVSPETFARHLDWLGRRFAVTDLDGFSAWIRRQEHGPGTHRPVALITFDDGWWDNAEYALPALRERAVSAVFFLAADYIGGDGVFWQERLSYLLDRLRSLESDAARALLAEAGLARPSPSRAEVIDAVRVLKDRDEASVENLAERARALLEDARARGDVDRFMAWTDIELLREAGQNVESHGCSHQRMPRQPDEALYRELTASREHIAERTGRHPFSIAYPNGDHDERVMERARSAGYQLAFTTGPGAVEPGDEPLAIPRLNMDQRGSGTQALFMARLAGIF